MENFLLAYLGEFGKGFLLIIATLLPIMNPPGNAALFLSTTDGASTKTRHSLAKMVSRNSFLMLLAFILLGSLVLKLFGISKDIVLIGGGILVMKMGWGLVTADDSVQNRNQAFTDSLTPEKMKQTAFFPLSFPITVGPGTLAACLTVGANFNAPSTTVMVIRLLGGFTGIVAIAIIVRVCYGYAEKIITSMGVTGGIIFMRISAFILLCIGIQLMWNGFANSVTELYYTLSNSATPLPAMIDDGISSSLLDHTITTPPVEGTTVTPEMQQNTTPTEVQPDK